MNFRSKLGVLALVLLAATAVCWIFFPDRPELLGTFARISIVISVVWALLPETATPASLAWIGGLVVAAVFLWRLPAPARWGVLLGSPVLAILFWPQLRALLQEARRQRAAARDAGSSRGGTP